MKLTKREVVLITILLIAGLLYGTYALILKPLQARYFDYLDEKNNVEMQELELQTRLNQKAVLEKEQAEIEDTMLSLNKATIDPLIPELISNRLLDQLADNGILSNGLNISQVSPLTGSHISVMSLEEQQSAAAGGETGSTNEEQETTGETLAPDNDVAELARQNNPANQNAPEPETEVGEILTINMSFNGTYNQVYDFLATLEAEGRAVDINNVTMTMVTETAEETPQPATEPMLAVTAVINYFSVEISDEAKLPNDPYTKPVFEQPDGKEQPFG